MTTNGPADSTSVSGVNDSYHAPSSGSEASGPGPLTASATPFTPQSGEFHNNFQLVLE